MNNVCICNDCGRDFNIPDLNTQPVCPDCINFTLEQPLICKACDYKIKITFPTPSVDLSILNHVLDSNCKCPACNGDMAMGSTLKRKVK